MRSVFLVSASVLFLAAAVAAQAQTPEFSAAATGQILTSDELELGVLRGGVYAHLPAGSKAEFLDIHVAAAEPSVVYLAASSRFVFAACLTGAIDGGTGRARPGEVIVWDFAGSKPEVQSFDVGRFLASSPLEGDPAIRQSLETARERQKDLVFWGLLQRRALNLQAPQTPTTEDAMRQHLSVPTVVQLRRAAGSDLDSLPRRVADRFIAAFVAREEEPVSSLLHPDLFQSERQGPGDWLAVRAAYAKSLLAGPLPQQLQGAVVSAGSDWAHWQVRTVGRNFVLSLAAVDGMPFVVALETPPPERAAIGFRLAAGNPF